MMEKTTEILNHIIDDYGRQACMHTPYSATYNTIATRLSSLAAVLDAEVAAAGHNGNGHRTPTDVPFLATAANGRTMILAAPPAERSEPPAIPFPAILIISRSSRDANPPVFAVIDGNKAGQRHELRSPEQLAARLARLEQWEQLAGTSYHHDVVPLAQADAWLAYYRLLRAFEIGLTDAPPKQP
jgi:hypothetical protein